MTNKKKNPKRRQHSFLLYTSAILILSILIPSGLVGCGPRAEDLAAVDYTPLPGDDWQVSTPAEQGLDPMLVAELYHDAAELETLYGLLVVKNGYLIAEGYFDQGSVERKNQLQSATKSFTSALVGIALEQGCLVKRGSKDESSFRNTPGRLPIRGKSRSRSETCYRCAADTPMRRPIPLFLRRFCRVTICPSSNISHSPAIREPSFNTAA